MFRTLKYFDKYSDWRMVGTAGALGFAISFAALEFIGAEWLSLSSRSIALAAAAGALLSMALFGWARSWRIVQKLGEHNSQLDVALNNMIQGLCMFDAQNRLVVWNQRYQTMYNIDPRHIRRGCGIRDLLDARKASDTFPHDPAKYEAELRAALEQGRTFTLNIELKDGRIIAVVNQPTEGGGWVATHEDITERKRAERDLEHTRSFLDTIIENVPSPIIVKGNPGLRYLLINRAAEKYLSIDRVAMLGKAAADIMPKATALKIDAEDRKLIESGQGAFHDEHAIVTPGNGTRIVTSTRLPVFGSDGKPQYLISVINDVTEHKRNEQRIAHMAHHD